MYPILFSIGSLPVPSFGFFLSLGLIITVFIIWRMAHLYEVKEEVIIDLTILTFLGSLIGARFLAVVLNWHQFGDLWKIILINRYPGLSFWGGLIAGVLILIFFIKRYKLNKWQILDFAALGFSGGLVAGNIGCFLGGCAYGVVSNLPIATQVVGVVGRRFPVSLIESFLLLLIYFYLHSQIVKFHLQGKIVAKFLILFGVVKFITEFYRGDSIKLVNNWILAGHFFSVALIIAGIALYYYRAKRSVINDLKSLKEIIVSGKKRQLTLSSLRKSWYNHQVNLQIALIKLNESLKKLPGKIKRRLNVKPTPTNY